MLSFVATTSIAFDSKLCLVSLGVAQTFASIFLATLSALLFITGFLFADAACAIAVAFSFIFFFWYLLINTLGILKSLSLCKNIASCRLLIAILELVPSKLYALSFFAPHSLITCNAFSKNFIFSLYSLEVCAISPIADKDGIKMYIIDSVQVGLIANAKKRRIITKVSPMVTKKFLYSTI